MSAEAKSRFNDPAAAQQRFLSLFLRSEREVFRYVAAPRFMTASTAAFASLFEFQQRSLAGEAFRHGQWQCASAQLNQDPSLVVRFDFENLA